MTLRGPYKGTALSSLIGVLILDLLAMWHVVITGGIWQTQALLLLLAASLASGISIFIYHNLLAPLATVNEALRQAAAGSLTARADISEPHIDEIALLTRNFNRLADSRQIENINYRNIIKTLPEPVFEIDHKGYITYMNAAACSATGYDFSDLSNSPIADILPAATEYLFEDSIKRIVRDNAALKIDIMLCGKNRRLTSFEFTCSPVSNERRTSAIICIGRNIDECKGLLDELQGARAQIDELSKKLQRARNELEVFALLAARRECKMRNLMERSIDLEQRGNGLEI